jgi:hypothetical protein
VGAAGAAITGYAVGSGIVPAETLQIAETTVRYVLFGAGSLMAARTAWQGVSHLIAARAPETTDAEKVALATTAARLDRDFDVRLSFLMLADEKFLTQNLRIYRDEYMKLRSELESESGRISDELRDQRTKLGIVAEAFDVKIALPGDTDDADAWAEFFDAIESDSGAYAVEDYVKLMQKRDLIAELCVTRATLRARAGELQTIENEEFPALEAQVAAAYQRHRERVGREDLKLNARRVLNDDDTPSYALAAHGEALNEIALSFIASFRSLYNDVNARLGAAATAENPLADETLRMRPPSSSREASGTDAADHENAGRLARARAYETSQSRTGGRP